MKPGFHRESDMDAYSRYLKGRTWTGLLYGKFHLYPRLGRRLAGRVPDVGCSIGDFVAFRLNTAGIDTNEHNVSFCQKRGLNVKVTENDRILRGRNV